jgi:hypothetical protein
MQKGFGLIFILIGVLFILLAAGAGFWWGRRSLPQTNPVITSASLNQNQSTASAQSTTFMKRSFDPTQGLYPEKPLPQEITGVAEENLTGFNCDGPYIQNSDGQYLWSLQFDGEAYLKPLSTDITTCPTSCHRLPSQKIFPTSIRYTISNIDSRLIRTHAF